ncbi:MAG: hypothetical protein H6722_17790 [Sandaracinus sp.]|nr:hypothetical protein [Sandaracinus sp.]MCB9614292.1 hypothetical protein [Sandaracinus sp.]
MKRFHVLTCVLGLALALGGCGDDDTRPADSGPGTDTGPRPDTGPTPDGGGECVMSADESGFEQCNDGCDNDGDGFMDCGDTGDFGCTGSACAPVCETTGPENTEEACTDGCDNDGDGFVDCRDRDCSGFCPSERSNVACSDGIDNDGNGFTDCEDFSCFDDRMEPALGLNVCLREMTNAACSDGMDNDGDGMTDCADDSCQGDGIVVCDGATATGATEAQWPAMIAAQCENDMDDDGNGFGDCADFSCLFFHEPCRALPPEQGNGPCSDGMDNDGDGLADCDDPGCSPTRNESIVVCDAEGNAVPFADAAAITVAANLRCSDTMNNDGNMSSSGMALTDCGDFTCARDELVTACDATGEGNTRNCNDEMDNNSNTFVDCNDNACSRNANPAVCADLEKGAAECSDGMDNDGNGFPDCNDFSCQPLDVCSGRLSRM